MEDDKKTDINDASNESRDEEQGRDDDYDEDDDDEDEDSGNDEIQQKPLERRKKREPPKRAKRAPVQFYRTADNKLRRVYRNRCERYCLGPLGIFVDSIGIFVLIIINLNLLSFAVVCLGLGTTILRKSDPYDDVVSAIRFKYDAAVERLGVTEEERSNVFDIEDYLQVLAVPFIVVGVIIASVSFMGIIGALCFYQALLQLYTRVSAILLLVEFCLFLFIYDGEPTVFKREMFQTLQTYSGYKGTDTITGAWNLLMQSLDCCGVESYLDFQSSDTWLQTDIGVEGKQYVTPVFCCKNKTRDFSCAEKGIANPQNNNMNRGCYKILYNFVFRYPYVQSAFYSVMICQIFVIFFSSWMYMSRDLQSLKPPPLPKKKTPTDDEDIADEGLGA